MSMVQSPYRDGLTTLEVGGLRSEEISMEVGVRQGDPLSPLLFNLAIDPLLHALECHGRGVKIAGTGLVAMAFADDLVLLSESWGSMNHNISILDDFCRLTGLKVHARKCFGFMLTPGGRSLRMKVNDCQPWEIGGASIEMVASERTVKYLGIQIGPMKGIKKPDALAELRVALEKVEAAPLSSPQKVWLVKTFVIPRMFYRADHCEFGKVLMKSLDQLLRSKIKAWLGLPRSTCNGLLYARAREGGLGVQKLGAMIPAMEAKRLWRLLHSEDRVIRDIAWHCRG